MPTRKRNDFLDIDESDDSGYDKYDEKDLADSRNAGLLSRSSKRRKMSPASGDESAVTGSDNGSVKQPSNTSPINATVSTNPDSPSPSTTQTQKPATIVSKRKPGVIYLSRIPPFMRPATVRTLLATHGPISKIFLTPEPPTTYLRRKKGGGNKKHSFVDGWVEFARKKHAKQCVDAINGQTVGGKKGGWYRDDVWNARYLRGFGWDDLMQGIRAEEREREEKVRVGTRREGRERGEFLKNFERSKVEETRRMKRAKRKQKEADKDSGSLAHESGVSEVSGERTKHRGFERRFRQNEVKGKEVKQIDQPEEVRRVLSKIF